jgi:hypothetical protein
MSEKRLGELVKELTKDLLDTTKIFVSINDKEITNDNILFLTNVACMNYFFEIMKTTIINFKDKKESEKLSSETLKCMKYNFTHCINEIYKDEQ